MKKLIPILLVSAMLTACGVSEPGGVDKMISEPEQLDLGAESVAKEESTEFTISTEWAEYDPSVGIVWFTLENHSGADVEIGADYALERFVEGSLTWYQVPFVENAAWNAIAYVLPDGGSIAMACHLSMFDYDFSDGTYRIMKEVEGKICTAEFRLKTDAAVSADTPYGFTPLEELPEIYGADMAAENDVVYTNGGVTNEDAVETFLHKVSLGTPCQLRTVQDYGEGAVMVIDTIYESDHFLWRMWNGGDVVERRYSYLVTDGEDVYLSNGADWDSTQKYDSEKALLVPSGDDRLLEEAAVMTGDRLAGSTVRYRLWSADGQWDAMLTEVPTEFGVSGPGWGTIYDLRDWDGLETAVTALERQEDGGLRLACETIDGGTTYRTFDPTSQNLE